MTYAYGMKNAPAVGQGLPGLPRREASGGGVAGLNSIFSAPLVNIHQQYSGFSGSGTISLGFTPRDIRNVVFTVSSMTGASEGNPGVSFILPEQDAGGSERVAYGANQLSSEAVFFWCESDGVINYSSEFGNYQLFRAIEYDVKVKNSVSYDAGTATTHTLPFSISDLRNVYLLGHSSVADTNAHANCVNFSPQYSDTVPACFVGPGLAYLEDAETFRIASTGYNKFHIIEYEANT